MADKALSGLKVLEFGEFISAPYCGKLLGDLGAEVIKIEKPGGGDRARDWGPFPGDIPHPEKSGLFLNINRNKSSITLDPESVTGREIFMRLVEWADVLIEANPPAKMEKLGFTYENLSKNNPGLIMTSITPFGQTGPYRDYKGNDLISAHVGGEAYGNPAEGFVEVEKFGPLKPPMHTADFMTGLSAGVCTMSAIYGRNISGKGQHIDLSAQEALASVVRQELMFYYVAGTEPSRQAGRKIRGGILYQCSDGHVCIWLGPHMPKLIKMMGDPDWANTEIFQDPGQRMQHMDEFNTLVNVWTMERTRDEIEKLGIEYSVPCAPVRSVEELVNDEQLAFREYFVDIDHPAAGKLRYPGAICKMTETPWDGTKPAPLLGQDNLKVYCDMLGYEKSELVQMTQAGII